MTDTFKCSTCGQVHDGVPLSFAADFPDTYANMSREDRDARCIIGSDQCIIDQKLFFVRGCLEIPITGSDDLFLWGLWASIREGVYDQISESWELVGREKSRGPFKGRMANSLSVYPETLNLKLEIIVQPVGTRPLLHLEEAGHPPAIEQRSGISRARAFELASLLLHQTKS
jgi:hypothetical protein